MPAHPAAPPPADPYDPWFDVALRWPQVHVVVAPLSGALLGELAYPTIVLRAQSTAAQRRCTLAHEIVHLDRGGSACGATQVWSLREERAVHAEAARRLLPRERVLAAARALGPAVDARALADALDVDVETVRVRVAALTDARPIDRSRQSRPYDTCRQSRPYDTCRQDRP